MDVLDLLFNVVKDPLMYSITFLIYVILASVILPIPVETGLFNPNIHPIWLIILLAGGKGIGAFIVYNISKNTF